jgi:hypothetical protein
LIKSIKFKLKSSMEGIGAALFNFSQVLNTAGVIVIAAETE